MAAYRRASRWGLDGLAALEFLYLLERTRRYSGASLEPRFGFVFTPFLNPGLIAPRSVCAPPARSSS